MERPVFSKTTCLTPFQMNNPKNGEVMNLPCGKCLPCKSRRASGWSFRLRQEGKHAKSAFFITFTYDTDSVPITPNGFMTYDITHFQNFMKVLRQREIRKHKNKTKLTYYTVTEYGEEYHRPHFHTLLFNSTLEALAGKVVAAHMRAGRIAMDGKYQIIDHEIWPYGHYTIGQVSDASIGYCLIYMVKNPLVPQHKRDDRLPERSLMSKGLGKAYVERNSNWHKKDLSERFYIPIEDGKRIALPRYYKDKIYTNAERLHIGRQIIKRIENSEPITEADRLQQIEHNKIQLDRKSKKR